MHCFKLEEYIKVIPQELIFEVKNYNNFEVTHIGNNSKNMTQNSIFIAIKGSTADGHSYITSAIKNGARAVFYQDDIEDIKNKDITLIRIKNTYLIYSLISEKYFNYPSKNFKLLGITGTNGKTTSAYLLKEVLSEAGKKVGLISTVEYSFGKFSIEAERTTPDAFELQTLFYKMKEEQCEYVVMEVSSHALDQNRIGTSEFDGAIFTNLTGDHLDYHKTMENYFAAKSKLFTEHIKKNGISIINIDDEYGKKLISTLKNVKSIGFDSKSDFRITPSSDPFNRAMDAITFKNKKIIFNPSFLGSHNAQNITGVFALCYELGIGKEVLIKALSKQISVPGRLERVFSENSNILYFVDYAHTDDALFRVLTAIKNLNPNRIISVFGCGGNRDKTKRPRMEKVSIDLADITIITSDNPRNENPYDIINHIVKGIDETIELHGQDTNVTYYEYIYRGENHKFTVIEDRRKAIFEAVKISNNRDIIIVVGKGHEKYQEINGVRHHFSDLEVLKEAIKYFDK